MPFQLISTSESAKRENSMKVLFFRHYGLQLHLDILGVGLEPHTELLRLGLQCGAQVLRGLLHLLLEPTEA